MGLAGNPFVAVGTPGPHGSILASLPSGLCCRHTCGDTGVTPGPSLALSAYCRTMTLAGHWGRGSQMQHAKGRFWKEEVYAEARTTFSVSNATSLVQSRCQGNMFLFGEELGENLHHLGLPREDENRERLLLLERIYLQDQIVTRNVLLLAPL